MSSINVEMSGLSEAIAKLTEYGDDAEKLTLGVVTQLATDTRATAIKGIQSGPATGRVYKRGNVTHQASSPGQYPMTDTGRLASSVDMILPTKEKLQATVGTDVIYGPMQEFGTSRMAARPWLMPSFEQSKAKVLSGLRARFDRLVRGV